MKVAISPVNERRNIDSIIEELVTLPSLPDTLAKVTHLLNDPSSSLSDVGRVIAGDPAIALKTLRLVNSAYYGLTHKVASVEHAVAMLGERVIKNLVLTATIFDSLMMDAGALLRHCIGCGVAMGVLVDMKHTALTITKDEAFSFGLLHDVGKIILQEYMPVEFHAAVKSSREHHIELTAAEREHIGADHAEVGMRLAVHWKLPAEMAFAIGAHHDLSVCADADAGQMKTIRATAATLAVADYLTIAAGMPSMANLPAHLGDDMCREACVSIDDVPAIVERFVRDYPVIDEMLLLAI